MNRRVFAQLTAGALASPMWLGAAELPAKRVRLSSMLWVLGKQASFDRSLEIVAEAGYQGLELTGQFQKWSADEWRRVMARLRSLGLVVDSASGVKAGFAVPDEMEAFHTQFAEHLQFAKRLECPQVIVLSGKRIASLDATVQRRTATENLKRAAEMAAKQQIEIVIEPIDLLENPTIYLTTVSAAFEIVRAVDAPQVKVLYDFYHEQRGYGNLIEKLEKNIDLVGLVHVADVPGRHEPGTGEIDYTMIYRKLAELEYSRWIAMEYYPTEEPVASLKKARETVERAFAMGSR